MALGYTGLAAELLEMVKKQTLFYAGYMELKKQRTHDVAVRLARDAAKPSIPSLAFTLNALMLGNYSTSPQADQRVPFKALPRYCYGNAFSYWLKDPEAAPVVGGMAWVEDYRVNIQEYDVEEVWSPWMPLTRGDSAPILFTEHGFNVLPDGHERSGRDLRVRGHREAVEDE